MVKSTSKKTHLKVNNDLELDFNNASISKKNRKSKSMKDSSSPIVKKRRVSNYLKSSRRKASASRRKVSDSRRKVLDARKKASDARRKGSGSRRKSSDSRRRISNTRRKTSDTRRRASDSRAGASDAKRKTAGRHSLKSKASVMSSVAKREALASSSRGKALSQNPGFSLKVKAMKRPSPGSNKKSRSRFKRSSATSENKISQKMVRTKDAPKKDTNGDDKSQTIYTCLDDASIQFINSNLLLEYRFLWRFLYSSQTHSRSLEELKSRVMYKGPTILVVRDTEGNVFGAHASTSWCDTDYTWVGNGECFLFSIKPKMTVFHSTGKDKNFQTMSDELLAMGGSRGNFGLFLNSDLSSGSSSGNIETFHTDTFQLTREAEFGIDHVEVWGLGPEPDEAEERSRAVPREPNWEIRGGHVDLDDLESQLI